MPKGRYTIGAKGAHGCPGYAVVGETGKVHGCHKTEQSARAQQAAMYANMSEKLYDGCCPEDNPFQKAQGPCWEGYEQVGFKTKNGKKVPNCVPKKKTKKSEGPEFEIRENHPGCEGVALVEVDGTSVLCYGSREEAQASLADMARDPEEASMRPNSDNKVWEGSGFDFRR